MCINNLGQIGKAIALYANDHDQYLPWGPLDIEVYQSADDGPFLTLPTVSQLLEQYGAEKTLFKCPLDTVYQGPDPVTGQFVFDRSSSFYSRTGSSYIILGSGPVRTMSLLVDAKDLWLGRDCYPVHGAGDLEKGLMHTLYQDLHVGKMTWAEKNKEDR